MLVTEDGAGTLDVLREVKPDLILMDILSPVDANQQGNVRWDGFATMDWLRCVGGDANQAPVILLTATDHAHYVERARKAGVVALFQKTAETADLMSVIHQLLD